MPYLTIFTLPKPFADPHISLIQHNALASWTALGPDAEVIVMGDDPGIGEAAAEHGARHLGEPAKNEFGTPLLDWAFDEAAAQGAGEMLCYVNADIIILPDLIEALRRLRQPRFLAIGQRWNCDITTSVEVSDGGRELAAYARRQGHLDEGRGSDYFAFPRSVPFGLPSFAVGRPGWDNWMIGRALQLQMPLIDLTPVTTVIHQTHDYGHVSQRTGSDWEGPEADRNRQLGGWLDRYLHTPANATHVLTPQRLRRPLSPRHARAKLEAFVALAPAAAPARRVLRVVRERQAAYAAR
jgi:hypothetical protein